MQGEQFEDKLVVPKLRVHKDWFRGLMADFIDHSHPDIGTLADAQDLADTADITEMVCVLCEEKTQPFPCSMRFVPSYVTSPRVWGSATDRLVA